MEEMDFNPQEFLLGNAFKVALKAQEQLDTAQNLSSQDLANLSQVFKNVMETLVYTEPQEEFEEPVEEDF
jgi:phosphotransferase system IIA component